MRLTPIAGKGAFQDYERFDLRHLEEPPADRARLVGTPGVPELVDQQLLGAVLDTVVVRLRDTHASVVASSHQAHVRDSKSQPLGD
jgi:hypothetical protein